MGQAQRRHDKPWQHGWEHQTNCNNEQFKAYSDDFRKNHKFSL